MKGHKVLTSSENDEYGTPQWLFDQLNSVYNFDLDAFASSRNAKCSRYFSEKDSALNHTLYHTDKVFMNPPYSMIKECMEWACRNYLAYNCLIVALVPNRSDTKWYSRYVKPHAIVTPIEGRLKFEGGAAGATFPSIIVTYVPKIICPITRRNRT